MTTERPKPKCQQCGNCCRQVGSPPFVDAGEMSPEIVRIVAFYQYHDPHRYDAAMPCYFLSSDNKCLIYDQRPQICRKFIVSGESCFFRKDHTMFSQQELQELWVKAQQAEQEVENPTYKRAYQRIVDGALMLDALHEKAKLREPT